MTELVTLTQEHQTATSLYGQTEHLQELFQAVRKVAPWANDQKQPMNDMEVGLVIRKAVAMGLDPLNAHEVQIWKDHRGSVNFQIGYPLTIEWVRHFHGEHTEPQYTRLSAEQLKEEGLSAADVAYRVSFLMKKDIPALSDLIRAGYDPQDARAMMEVTGLGVASAQEYAGQYFAPNARSKSWKVQKRALTDAYRRKFGTPTRREIEELRRVGGFDNLRPEDWEGGGGLATDDAAALAKSNAQWRERGVAMDDPVYRAAQKAQSTEAASALFGGPVIDATPTTEEAVTDWMEAQKDDAPTTPMAETPTELPSKWPEFCRLVMRDLRYNHMAHVLNAYKQETGTDYELPYHTVGAQAGQMIDASGTWAVLAAHKLRSEDGIPF